MLAWPPQQIALQTHLAARSAEWAFSAPPHQEINPLFTISRSLAQHVAKVFRRALPPARNLAADYPLQIASGPDGLSIRSATPQIAVEYREPTPLPEAALIVPWELFHTAASSKRDPVTIVLTADGVVLARWQEGAIPQATQWMVPDASRLTEFPTMPELLAENPPALRQALRDAFDTTDMGSIRYALGCIQFRGKEGSLAATDGRQILIQGGFRFGFDEELLVERASVFGDAGLPTDQPLHVARTENSVVVRLGPWTFHLAIRKEGRFPQVEYVIPRASSASSTLELHPADRKFLAASLPRLATEDGVSVTLDLHGSIAIRSKSQAAHKPSELILTNSHRSGDQVCLATDRRFLERAIEMGFDRLSIFGPDSPVCCCDASRTYVCALLRRNSVLEADAQAEQICSPPSGPLSPRHRKKRRLTPPLQGPSMPHPLDTTAVQTCDASATHPARKNTNRACSSSSDQAIQLRNELRQFLRRLNEMIR